MREICDIDELPRKNYIGPMFVYLFSEFPEHAEND